MALDQANLEFIFFQREQLQISVLEPLQRIKGAIGRCLPSQKVQTIQSLLSRDVRNDSFAEVDDGEILMQVFDYYYGEDNLNFIERLLIEANLQDLAQMLRNWKTRSRTLVPNIFHQYGFFPLWVKANYNFIEFSKRREEIFSTLRNAFGIPETDPSKDPMVFMGVSLGKRDVLLCVLVPHSLRHHIKTSLQNIEMASQLKSARICGVYFSRVKKGPRHEFHNDGIKGSQLSISSVSESMTSSDYGVLYDAAYEDVTNTYQTSNSNGYHGDSQSGRYGNDIVGKVNKPQLVRITEREIGNFKLDENGDINGYHGDDYSGRYGNESHNKPHLVRISSGYVKEETLNGYYENEHSGRYGDESDDDEHIQLQSVRVSSACVSKDPSDKVAKVEEQKPSYGRCYFVDYKKLINSESIQVNSNVSLPSRNINVNSCHYQTQDGRCSPQNVHEEIVLPQKSDFASDEPSRHNGNHSNKLLSQGSDKPRSEERVSPWYNDQELESEYNAEETNRWYSSSEALENERNTSYYGNDVDRGSRKDETEFDIPQHYHGDQQRYSNHGATHDNDNEDRSCYHGDKSYHRDENGDYEPKSHYIHNNINYHRDENGNIEGGHDCHRDGQDYHGNEYGYDDNTTNDYYGNDHSFHCKHDYNTNEYDYHRNEQNHHGNENSYLNEDTNCHDDEPSYHEYEQNKDDYDYHGNEPSYYNETHEDGDIMIPQPEPKPRPWSSGDVPNGLSTSSLSEDFEPVRRSTPTSSGSSFAKYQFSFKPDSISHSMPTLHDRGNQRAKSANWSDGNRKYRPKYQSSSQDDLEDNVFVETYSNSENYYMPSPPYSSPPSYKEAVIKKSFLSLSSVSVDSRCKKVTSPLLSSQSVGSIYKEKEQLLNREELQESIRSAEEKQWEILLDKSKEFLTAAKFGDEEEVQSLLDEPGVDVDYKNEFGHTALMIASRVGHLPVIHTLISYSADLNIQDKYGKSAVHEAAWSGHHQVIHPLVSKGANINGLDEEGRTPLQYAALRGKTKVAEVLLLLGADASILNKDGESAVESAYKCRHKDIVKLLLNSTDKETRKSMKRKLRKLRIARIKSTRSLPNLSKNKPLKGYFKRPKSLQ